MTVEDAPSLPIFQTYLSQLGDAVATSGVLPFGIVSDALTGVVSAETQLFFARRGRVKRLFVFNSNDTVSLTDLVFEIRTGVLPAAPVAVFTTPPIDLDTFAAFEFNLDVPFEANEVIEVGFSVNELSANLTVVTDYTLNAAFSV